MEPSGHFAIMICGAVATAFFFSIIGYLAGKGSGAWIGAGISCVAGLYAYLGNVTYMSVWMGTAIATGLVVATFAHLVIRPREKHAHIHHHHHHHHDM